MLSHFQTAQKIMPYVVMYEYHAPVGQYHTYRLEATDVDQLANELKEHGWEDGSVEIAAEHRDYECVPERLPYLAYTAHSMKLTNLLDAMELMKYELVSHNVIENKQCGYDKWVFFRKL